MLYFCSRQCFSPPLGGKEAGNLRLLTPKTESAMASLKITPPCCKYISINALAHSFLPITGGSTLQRLSRPVFLSLREDDFRLCCQDGGAASLCLVPSAGTRHTKDMPAPVYTPPLVEVVLVEVERGMAASDGGSSTGDMDIEDLQAD